jgi:aldehyde:ferredoxin oxidoreductase
MSKTVTIPVSVFIEMRDNIRLLKEAQEVSDLVNFKKAGEILGIKGPTLTNYICKNKVQVESIGPTGEKFFSARKLKGIQG